MSTLGVLISTARGLLGLMLIVAGAAKLVDAHSFQATLRSVGTPRAVVRPLSVAIPSVELGVGLFTLAGVATLIADAFLVTLTGGFLAVASIAVLRRVQVECRCFGQLGRATFHVGAVRRTGVLFALAIGVIVGDRAVESSAALSVSTVLVVLAGVAFAAVCGQAARVLELVSEP